MKKGTYSQFILATITLFLLALLAGASMAQESNLCAGFYLAPNTQSKKPADTVCVVIENGFMYKKAEEIIKLSGLPMNFVVCKTSRMQNAFATLDKYGNRYIKYDDVFMKKLNRDSSALESLITLAHEIGHHIFFHTVLTGANDMALNYQQYGIPGSPTYDPRKFKEAEEQYYEVRRRQELEADRFAGFILSRKGVPLDKVVKFYEKLGKFYKGKNEATHPPVDKRIAAVKTGFIEVDSLKSGQAINLTKLGNENLDLVFNNTSKLERERLLRKIEEKAIAPAADFFTKGEYRFYKNLGGHASFIVLGMPRLNALRKYLGKDIDSGELFVDDGKDYIETKQLVFTLADGVFANYHYQYVFHIRGGYLYLIIFDHTEVKVAYKSRFSEDQISYEEIKLLFTRVLKPELQKVVDGYLK
jgi:hypothetical protein